MKQAFLAACLLSAPAFLPALEFDPKLDLSLGADYSAFQNEGGSWNGPGKALFIPMIKLGKSDVIAPVLAVDAKYRQKPLAEEAEPFLSYWQFLARPTYKHAFNKELNFTLTGQARRRVTVNEYRIPWSLGIYDYEEFGGGAKVGWHGVDLGFNWSHKDYPNNKNPAPSGSKNYYIKDLDTTRIALDYDLPKLAGLMSSLGYSLSLRNYTDSYILKADGTLDSPLRSEQLHLARATVEGVLGASLVWSAGLEMMMNASNQNEFDIIINKPKKNTESFTQWGLLPSITWLANKDPKGTRVSLSWRSEYKAYADRLVRDSSGVYSLSTQTNAVHEAGLRGTWAGFWISNLDVFGDLQYAFARSNQGYETSFRYTYDLFMAQAGLEYRI